MKKTLSLLMLGILLAPPLLFAETGAPRAIPTLYRAETTAKNTNTLHTSTSTKPRIEEKREVIKEMLRDRATTTRGTATSTRQGGFCQDIDKTLLSIDAKVTKTKDKRDKMASTTDQKRDTLRAHVVEKRSESETNKKAQLAELKKRATTDAQKQAVATFTTSMEQALKIRDVAMDQLLLSYRTEVDKATSARRMETEQALAIRKADIEVAKTKAKSDCASSLAPETVRNTLRQSVEKAQATFLSTVMNIEKVKDITEEMKNTKKAELKKIEEAYISTMKKAKEDLKLSFKVTAVASSTKQ